MLNHRNEQEMHQLIIKVAKQNTAIRSVILSGSRTNLNVKKDIFQDYDIVYGVTDVEPFVVDETWLQQFGDLLIMQKPDEIDQNWPANKDKFAYLMQFKDWNRIDLTLIKQEKITQLFNDYPSTVLLDKDNVLVNFNPGNAQDYLPQPPSFTDFNSCCNEFFWSSLSAAKGLWRKELLYVKFIMENILREELLKLMTWYAGIKTEFKQPMGKFSKNLPNYIEARLWQDLCNSYVGADYEQMWQSLFTMCQLFNEAALKISSTLGFSYNENEYQSISDYLQAVKKY